MFQYDVIGRYENLNDEVDHVIRWLGAPQFIGRFPKSDRSFHASEVYKKYLTRLTSRLKIQLMSSYLTDFLLFGYDLIQTSFSL